jgi:hypothetical protein
MKSRSVILLLSLLATMTAPVLAEPPQRELSPEERREMRKQMREHWQRENVGPQRPGDDATPASWRDLPPEERLRLRKEMREQHDRGDKQDKRRPRKGD